MAENYVGAMANIQNQINALIADDYNVDSLHNGTTSFKELKDQIRSLSITMMCTSLKALSWRTLICNPAISYDVPPGHFIAGVHCNDRLEAALILPINPYWAMMRDHVKELDHSPLIDAESFTKATERIREAALKPQTLSRDEFANMMHGSPLEARVVNGKVIVPGIDVPLDADVDKAGLDYVAKTGTIGVYAKSAPTRRGGNFGERIPDDKK